METNIYLIKSSPHNISDHKSCYWGDSAVGAEAMTSNMLSVLVHLNELQLQSQYASFKKIVPSRHQSKNRNSSQKFDICEPSIIHTASRDIRQRIHPFQSVLCFISLRNLEYLRRIHDRRTIHIGVSYLEEWTCFHYHNCIPFLAMGGLCDLATLSGLLVSGSASSKEAGMRCVFRIRGLMNVEAET
jgi:hypothetical protein